MKYIKLFESFKSKIIVHHGGNIKLTDKNIKTPIFTTPFKKLANWYASNWYETGNSSWVTTLKITIENPLISKKENFDKWIPILKELNVDYKYDKNGSEHNYFKCDDILKYGGYMSENINDVIYIPGFLNIAIKYGYDGIYGFDSMLSGLKEIYIPFIKNNIKILKSEKFDPKKHDISSYP